MLVQLAPRGTGGESGSEWIGGYWRRRRTREGEGEGMNSPRGVQNERKNEWTKRMRDLGEIR